ncbi:MAG: lasso RiPP family leader peptide-containing protein [Nitrospiria bacterium]
MKSKTASKRKNPYRSPRLVKYGSLAQITRGGGGSRRDGGAGSPKTKASGGA